MSKPQRLLVTRRTVLAWGPAAFGALVGQQAFAAEGAGGGRPKTQIVEVFRGTAKEVSLESSDIEGSYPAKYLVLDDAPNAGNKTLAWLWDSPLRNGEAQMERATLTLRDDGYALFSAILQSRSAGDHWNVLFNVYSKSSPSKSLFMFPKQPETKQLSPDGVALYQWLQFPAPERPLKIAYELPRFDPKLFGDLGDVALACDC